MWSIGNELSSQPGPVQTAYLDAASSSPSRWTRRGRSASPSPPTRARSARPSSTSRSTCSASTTTSAGTRGRAARSSTARSSSAYLDAARACYPDKALMVTEFGAEANRDGPIEEKGTWAFQQDWVNFHLGVFATKPWLSGALYWTLNEFWVRPGWEGGNPRPALADPPEGPGHLRRRAQAGVDRRAALVHADPAADRAVRAPLARGDAARGARARPASRRRTRRRLGSASLSWPERRRLSDWTANGSGIPPDGEVFGLSETRSLPPPPESSSSSGDHVDAPSERRNIRNRAPPSTRATRWRTPKITSSSASEDIAQ